MDEKTLKWIRGIGIATVVLALLSIGLGVFTSLGYLESFRIVFGSVYVLFIPGFIISYIFFPFSKPFEEETGKKSLIDKGVNVNDGKDGKAIDWIERIALSFALSIAVVPLVMFYLNFVGVKINVFNSFFVILGIIVVSFLILWFRLRKLNVK